MIRDEIRIISACSASAMKGNANNNVTKIARIFGTNTSVCSWICVSAWNSDTTTPTTRPTTIRGDNTTTMVQIASRATSRVSAPVIFDFHSLVFGHFKSTSSRLLRMASSEWKPTYSPLPIRYSPLSDRHLHDVFVGLDHAVAHRDQRRHGDVGLRHRGDHVHHIGLAGCHRDRLGVGFAPRIGDAAEGVLEHGGKGRPGRLGALAGAGTV